LTWNIQDELAQTDRKHRFKYPGDNGEDGRHLEGVEISTGEADHGVTKYEVEFKLFYNFPFLNGIMYFIY
jgi:hypothetical protein